MPCVDSGRAESGLVWFDDIPAFLAKHKIKTWIVHNAHFDILLAHKHFGIIPQQIVDTRAMAHHIYGAAVDTGVSNHLADLARREGLPIRKGDLSWADGLHARGYSSAELEATDRYARTDAEITLQLYQRYLPRLSRPDFELWLQDHTIRSVYLSHLQIDTDNIERATKTIAAREAELLSEVSARTVTIPILKKGKKGRKTLPDEPDTVVETPVQLTREVFASNPMFADILRRTLEAHGRKLPTKKNAKKVEIPALAKTDSGFQSLFSDPVPLVRQLAEIRQRVTSNNQVFKRLSGLKIMAKAGGLTPHLNYYGAHTGRWSGGGGFNLQNLTSPDRARTEAEAESARAIRSCIQARPGHVFVDVDCAQIERRIISWLAGQENDLKAFREGHDLYSEFISRVIGQPVQKPTPEMDSKTAKWHKARRGLGKEAELGLGYGMGRAKFVSRALMVSDIRALVDDGSMTEAELGGIVARWRELHPEIIQFWKSIEKAFHVARQGGSQCVANGRIQFILDEREKLVHAILPSGRSIRYLNIKRRKREGGKFYGDEWVFGLNRKIYGGSLTENVVQGIARDILAEGIYSADVEGIRTVLHVHDSIIAEVPEEKGQETLDRLIFILQTPPSWADGLPLDAEGCISKVLK